MIRGSRKTLLSLFLSNVLVGLIIAAVIGIGWIMNIVKFSKCDFKDPYKAEIVRGIGIPVVPMGAIMGYMKIED